jgi:hypothetical protein
MFWGSNSLPDPRQQAVAGAGQTISTRLSTRRAGVHVDFHAHRHFHNLRSFPTHQASPKQCWHDVRAGIKTRLTSNVAQARNIRRRRYTDASDAETSLLSKATSLLDKANKRKRRISHIGHDWKFGSLDKSCLLQSDTSGMSERRPKRRQSDTASATHPQQSLSASAVLLSALAPSACCAAVGSPCICR